MNILLKRMVTALLAALIFCAFSASALAANTGSITLEIKDDDDKPVAGFEVYLVRAADKDGKLVDELKAAGIAPDKLLDEKNNAKNAKKLLAYVDDAAAEKKTTTTNGRLAFKNLEEGIYLIYDAGNDGHKFDPFLVKMPTVINGSADYDIVASPKIDPITPPGGGGGGGGTPPTPTPTPEPSDDPNDPTPTPGDEPTPSPGPSDPVDPSDPPVGPTPPGGGGEGGGEEPGTPGVPGGGEGGEGEEEPGIPTLPLTGVERRPIWILLGLGVALIIVGVFQLGCRREKA